MFTEAFSQFFSIIKDPRKSAKTLFDILFLTVCATIAGMKGWEDIKDFDEVHLDWFQDRGLFLQGIPVHDIIARVVSSIEPEQFQDCF